MSVYRTVLVKIIDTDSHPYPQKQCNVQMHAAQLNTALNYELIVFSRRIVSDILRNILCLWCRYV